jgi:hypothetical protein
MAKETSPKMKKVNFTKADGITTANVKDLYLFKDNPRDVEAKDFERLKKTDRIRRTLSAISYGRGRSSRR